MNNVVRGLIVTKDNKVIAVGDFTSAGGDGSIRGVTYWEGPTATWYPMGTGLTGAPYYALCVTLDPAGNVYVGGSFLSMGGVANTAYIAKWNWVTWSSLDVGMDALVRDVTFDNTKNILYAVGFFTTAGGITLPDSAAIWTGSAWIPLDIDEPGAPTINYSVMVDGDNLYLGNGSTGNATSATVKTPVIGSSSTFPVVRWTGPGTIYQLKNYTTGRAIYFNLTLLPGETATLNLSPLRARFQSSFRGDIMDTIIKGSNLDFPLLPGINNISTFIFGSTAGTTAVSMYWRNRYWSEDGTIWR